MGNAKNIMKMGEIIMYLVIKTAIYQHGVFFICNELGKAIEKANEYAKNDSDSYHSWKVVEYSEVPINRCNDDADHVNVYTTYKPQA